LLRIHPDYVWLTVLEHFKFQFHSLITQLDFVSQLVPEFHLFLQFWPLKYAQSNVRIRHGPKTIPGYVLVAAITQFLKHLVTTQLGHASSDVLQNQIHTPITQLILVFQSALITLTIMLITLRADVLNIVPILPLLTRPRERVLQLAPFFTME